MIYSTHAMNLRAIATDLREAREEEPGVILMTTSVATRIAEILEAAAKDLERRVALDNDPKR